MSLTVTHPFVSLIADSGNTSLVQPSDWNDDHTVVGDATATTGYVLVGQGAGSAPVWAAPSSLSLLVVGTTTITGGATTRILYDNAGVLGEYTITGSGTVVAMQTSPRFITDIAPTANDGAAIGTSALSWSDAFFATGGVVNWNAGNVTFTHASNTLTFGGSTLGSLVFAISGTTASTTSSNGALTVAGGVGILGQLNVTNGQSGGSASPSPAIKLGAYFDNAGDMSISHIDVYNGAYGFGIASATFAYISASGGLHKFYTQADLTAANFAVSIGAYNTASTTPASGALLVQGGAGITGAVTAGDIIKATVTSGYSIALNVSTVDNTLRYLNSGATDGFSIGLNRPGDSASTTLVISSFVSSAWTSRVTIAPAGLLTAIYAFSRGVPVTETGTTHTVAATTTHLICDNVGTVTVTFPSAASFVGREIFIKNINGTATVISASSNIVLRTGGAAGTALLAAADGAWAFLVSDGTNWIVMAGN